MRKDICRQCEKYMKIRKNKNLCDECLKIFTELIINNKTYVIDKKLHYKVQRALITDSKKDREIEKLSYWIQKLKNVENAMICYNVYKNYYFNSLLFNIKNKATKNWNWDNEKYLKEIKKEILTFKYPQLSRLPQFENYKNFETSIDFWLCYGWSKKEAKEKTKKLQKNRGISIFKTIKEKIKKDPLFYRKSSKRCKEYWIKQGLNDEDAKEAVSKHQLNFNLDICVCKHGVLNGYSIWFDRQRRWQDTLCDRPQEEIDDINFRKSKFVNSSLDKNRFIEKIFKEFENISKTKKESFSFEYWVSTIFFNINTIIRHLFDNDIENLYNKIPDYIKKSFKNNPKIFRQKSRNHFNMYTKRGELLKSSGEICFYFLLKKNKIDYLCNQTYTNSRMMYDFYLPKYDLYIEIAGMMDDEEYKEKMIKKHKEFDAVILKSEREQELFFIDLSNKKYKKKQNHFDMSLLF